MRNSTLPIPEVSFVKLNGGKIFSKLDFSDAYLQISVDSECPKYIKVNTRKGLHEYKMLPFGLKVAQAIFQQTMDVMLED